MIGETIMNKQYPTFEEFKKMELSQIISLYKEMDADGVDAIEYYYPDDNGEDEYILIDCVNTEDK